MTQLLGVYLIFVVSVLATGLAVNLLIQQRLRAEVQTADLALAQTIALETDDQMRDARDSLGALSSLRELHDGDIAGMERAFRAFKAARPDVDRVYWLSPNGTVRVSVPANVRTQDTDFSQQPLFQQAMQSDGPVIEAGIVDLTTFNAVVAMAQPVRDQQGTLLGIVATNLLLDDFNTRLRAVVDEQARHGQELLISVVNDQGQLVASPERERLLQPILDELPGAREALAGETATRLAPGPQSEDWLFSAVPMPGSSWAVVVQRPAAKALSVITTFNTWLRVAAFLFALGGLLFWTVLLSKVIRPLHRLATTYQGLPTTDPAHTTQVSSVARRSDEVGELARALQTLEQDVTTRLTELHTLLETSKVVVSTLDPPTVVQAIIREVQRLVDVQAAAVFVPDDEGVLQVLASEGRSEYYTRALRLRPDDPVSPAVRALREGQPVQIVAGESGTYSPPSFQEGFKTLLAIPIQVPHAGGVALVVHRTEERAFSADEVDLLMTFAHYAALAWEHAVLYERSDVRLREEQQTLVALMSSMRDGLVLAGVNGEVLYTNRRASALIGIPTDELEHSTLDHVHMLLRARVTRPEVYDRKRADAEVGTIPSWMVEVGSGGIRQSIQLRLFDVHAEHGDVIGRGLLLRDVTREQEIDEFKSSVLAAVGHELRTPLAAIIGHASTLLQDDVAWTPTQQRRFLQTIRAEATRIAQLVNNLLDLSRMEAGLLQLECAPWRLEDLVSRSVSHLNASTTPIVVNLPADLPPVVVDGPRIEVVLRNLLSNAIAYGDGEVTVTAEQRAHSVVVRVSDNGPGLTDDELRQVFERFYRTARGQERRSGGTGLGLAICKAFVEAHSGAIWAENTVNGGVFAFRLPTDSASNESRRAATNEAQR